MGLISNGTTLLDAGSISAAKGALTLIKTLTASSSSTLSFIDGSDDVVLDNTYKEYQFHCINLHPSGDGASLTFQGNAAGGSGFDETMQNNVLQAYHREDGGAQGFGYETGFDQANGTGFCRLIGNNDSANDSSHCVILHLFNPSDTTFVKHFFSISSSMEDGGAGSNPLSTTLTAGYFNTTSAIDEIQFKMNTGNIDSGTIKLYGVS